MYSTISGILYQESLEKKKTAFRSCVFFRKIQEIRSHSNVIVLRFDL